MSDRSTRLLSVLFVCAVLLPGFKDARAQSVRYVYNDLGRLMRVVDETTGDVATYHYDAVGNILSITRETLNDIQPRFDGITPSGGRADSSVQVTISGANLEGSVVTTDNPGILVTDSQAGDAAVTASFDIAAGAPQGPATVSITNGLGSTAFPFTVFPPAPQPAFMPRVVAVVPGGSAQIDVVLSNADAFDTTVNLVMTDTGVATVSPAVVTIPAGQVSAPVTIDGVANGTTTVTASAGVNTAAAAIFVGPAFSGQALSAARPLSVEVATPPTPSPSPHPELISALPVSVQNPGLPSPTASPHPELVAALPVSVDNPGPASPTPTIHPELIAALPVSVQNPGLPSPTPTAHPELVSALPVSVENPAPANPTPQPQPALIFAPPVSAQVP